MAEPEFFRERSCISIWIIQIYGSIKREKLQKIADYFGVGIEYFTGEGPVEETSNQGYYIDEETARTAQEIYNNDKILFDVYNTVDKERLVDFAKKLAELRKLEEGEE